MATAMPSPVAREGRWTSLMAWLNAFARKQPLGVIGALILMGIVLLALLAPVMAPFDPYAVHVTYKYAAPGTVLETTGQRFWLGADQLGRDTLSRLVYGARISLYVSLISVGIGVTLGALVGIMSAHFGGMTDLLIQRLVDTVMAFGIGRPRGNPPNSLPIVATFKPNTHTTTEAAMMAASRLGKRGR
jgi:peptide/nickel transport system permease protein